MILDKVQLVNNINLELSDNATGQISPYDIRHNLLDIIDSIHLLTFEHNLKAKNFSTPQTRTTLAGQSTIENILLQGYVSVDNSAFGHAALKSNYRGYANTAVGSNSLACNIHGVANTAIGVNSLGGNTVGNANVGLGNHTLINNKIGNFNIAIGNAAGYYATRDTNYKLFIASHPIEDGYICANPLGSGLTPLVYGDLNQANLKLGVAVRDLHDYGTLQVSGGITPSLNNYDDIGHDSVRFKNIFLANGIDFSNNLKILNQTSFIGSSGNFAPSLNNSFSLGTTTRKWSAGHFQNLYVSGVATINTISAIYSNNYYNKTLYLAASGSTSSYGYLSDEQLLDAGLIIKSSGVDYLRDYEFVFSPTGESIASCLSSDVYVQSNWNSNISLTLDSGRYLRSNNIIGYGDISLYVPSNCFGFHIQENNRAYLSNKNIANPLNTTSSGTINGLGNVNFFSESGVASGEYIFALASLESGVNLTQRFINGSKQRVKDGDNYDKDKLDGFDLKYIDDLNSNIFASQSLGITDRFAICSYNDSSESKNALILMKDHGNAVVGITNISPEAENIIPNTILNLRSNDDAIVRVTAENIGDTEASIQLLAQENCEFNGAEFTYRNGSGIADINMFVNSGEHLFVRLYEDQYIGLFTPSGYTEEMLTLGDDYSRNAIVSIHTSSGTITSSPKYSKLFVKTKVAPQQDHTVYLLDGSGYLHDLVVNKYDSSDGRAVFIDFFGNTYAGNNNHNFRNVVSPLGISLFNTGYGSAALASLSGGDYNTAIGSSAGYGTMVGNNNVFVGDRAGQYIASGNNNIIIGKNAYAVNAANYQGSHNIIIGTEVVSLNHSGDYNLAIGHDSDSNHLIRGVMGPNDSDKRLDFQHGNLYIHKTTDQVNQNVLITHSGIKVNDLLTKAYPDQTFSINFNAASGNDILILSHSGALPVSGTATYATENPARPYAQFNSDVRIHGAIRFSDNTSLDSASFLSNISNLQSGVNQTAQLFIEGYITSEIKSPSNPSVPTSGYLISKDSNWMNQSSFLIINRDTTSIIHSGAYVIAIKINNEYRPMWISANTCENSCNTC